MFKWFGKVNFSPYTIEIPAGRLTIPFGEPCLNLASKPLESRFAEVSVLDLSRDDRNDGRLGDRVAVARYGPGLMVRPALVDRSPGLHNASHGATAVTAADQAR